MVRRGIDHLVVPVHDLDGAANLFARLGFQVGARNRHPWGTENRLIQFPGAFIELVTLADPALVPDHGPRTFSFGAFVRETLARREGLAMLVLDSTDAAADAAAFRAGSLGDFEPFFFERRGRGPDGSEVRVAFTLAFARLEAAPEAGFFVCQHHHPEAFWNEAFQRHPNGAGGISAVVLTADAPTAARSFLEGFTGVAGQESEAGQTFSLARGRIDVLTRDAAAPLYGGIQAPLGAPSFVAFDVAVPSVEAVRRRLILDEIPHQAIGERRVVVPASAAHGVAIAFESP